MIAVGDFDKLSIDLNREQFWEIIYYNWKRGLTYDQCFDQMSTALGHNCVSKATVSLWYREFRRGRESLEDQSRSGRPITGTTDEMVAKVQKIIEDNPRVIYI